MSWVYFFKGYVDALGNQQPAGFYEVIVDDDLKAAGEVAIKRNPTGIDRVKDEWGLTNWSILPVKIAIGNSLLLNLGLWILLLLAILYFVYKRK